MCFPWYCTNGTDNYLFHSYNFKASHRRTGRGRASISSSTTTPTPPAKCSNKHKPPMETWKSPLMSSTTCYLFSNMHTKAKFKGGREDIQETCPKETSKGQWSTTKCISSICCIQQDVLMHRFLYLWGVNRKKAALGENPLKCLQCCDCKKLFFCISYVSKRWKWCGNKNNLIVSKSQ